MKTYFYYASVDGVMITSGAAQYKSKKAALKAISGVLVHRGISGNFSIWVKPMKKADKKFQITAEGVPVTT